MTTLSSRALIPTMLDQQIDLSTPIIGGDTLWTNMYAAYDALPQAMKSMLHELSAIHDMGTFRNDYLGETMDTNAVNEAMRELGSAVHPITPVHPVTGKRFLYDHINQPEFQVRYRWQAGSMVLWDNRVTQHYAIADYLPHYRRMHRVTVVDDARV
jgi:taurine dioxygenase